jgi:hypothetical protein
MCRAGEVRQESGVRVNGSASSINMPDQHAYGTSEISLTPQKSGSKKFVVA